MDVTILQPDEWIAAARVHAERADTLTAGHRARRARREPHAIEDFLFDYYGVRPARLRRWHPGRWTALAPGPTGPPTHAGWRWYTTDSSGVTRLDVERFRQCRGETVRVIRDLLTATASRQPFTGCFGLHEWAMVYRQDEHRHPLPLRLGQAGTDAVVESSQIRCSHFDAFRFFTPAARGLNRLQPTRASQIRLEQPGCLHAAMDCLKWATKLGPAVPGDLTLDCFELASEIRLLDMRASPYDLSSYGERAVRIETPEGRAEYVARQRDLTSRAGQLRARLTAVCDAILPPTPPTRPTHRPPAEP